MKTIDSYRFVMQPALWPPLVLALSFLPARAVEVSWDSNGAADPLRQDGPGTWDTATQNWVDSLDANVVWVNANNDVAVFGNGGSGGPLVTLGTGITANGLTFKAMAANPAASNSAAYDVGASTLAFTNVTGLAAGQIVTGPGIVPGTTISAILGDATSGYSVFLTNATTAAGGVGAVAAANAYTISGNTITLAGTTPTITANANVTAIVNSTLAGAAGLTKAGDGVAILSAANTYTGTTTISAGTLRLAGGNNRLPTGTTVILANAAGAVLDLNGQNQSIAFLSGGGTTGGNINLGAGTLTITTNNTSYTYGGVISGPGRLVRTAGNCTLTLSGASTYSGGTTLSGGGTITLNVAGTPTSGPLGTGPIAFAGGATIQGTGTQTGPSWTLYNNLEFQNGATQVTLAAYGTPNLIFEGPATLATGTHSINTGSNTKVILRGKVSGVGGIKSVGGTQELAGPNDYSGGTTIAGGTMVVNVDSVGSPGSITSGAMGLGTITFTGGTINALTSARTLYNALEFKNGATARTWAGLVRKPSSSKGRPHWPQA